MRDGKEIMDDWVPFAEGEYLVELAYLVTPLQSAVAIEDVVVEVYMGPAGRRRIQGHGRIRNALMVELLNDHDQLDVILDFGGEFKYRLEAPELQAGKVFDPEVRSALKFMPTGPWEQIPLPEFEALVKRLQILPSTG